MEVTPRCLPLASGGDGAYAYKASLLLSLQETLTAIAKNEQESSGLDMSFIAANRTNSELPPPPPDEVIPLQIVAQLVAGNLPRDSKVAKETKLLVQHSLTEFIAFVTSEAADICTSDKIRVTEIKQALTNLGARPTEGALTCTAAHSCCSLCVTPPRFSPRTCAQDYPCFQARRIVGNCWNALGSPSGSFHPEVGPRCFPTMTTQPSSASRS
jgi:histone H3/H4